MPRRSLCELRATVRKNLTLALDEVGLADDEFAAILREVGLKVPPTERRVDYLQIPACDFYVMCRLLQITSDDLLYTYRPDVHRHLLSRALFEGTYSLPRTPALAKIVSFQRKRWQEQRRFERDSYSFQLLAKTRMDRRNEVKERRRMRQAKAKPQVTQGSNDTHTVFSGLSTQLTPSPEQQWSES